MTQIGEKVAIDVNAPEQTTPGSLEITIVERSSRQAVEGVEVELQGPSPGSSTTDSNGQVSFPGLDPGIYTFDLSQDEFEMTPSSRTTLIGDGEDETVTVRIKRVLTTVVMK